MAIDDIIMWLYSLDYPSVVGFEGAVFHSGNSR